MLPLVLVASVSAHVVDVSFVDGRFEAPDIAIRVRVDNPTATRCDSPGYTIRWPSISGTGSVRGGEIVVPGHSSVDVVRVIPAAAAIGVDRTSADVALGSLHCDSAQVPSDDGGPGFDPPIRSLHPVFGRGGPVLQLLLRDPDQAARAAGVEQGMRVPLREIVRLGIGYELASSSRWLVYSAAAETNFVEDVGLVVSAHALTPLVPLGPHGPPLVGLGIGLGVPVDILPEPQAGLRFSTVMFLGGVVGIGTSIDVFTTHDRFRTWFGVRGSL
jgi:hypothetical protein